MHGNIFALAIIAMACATFAILKVYGKRPDRRAVVAGALLMIVTFFVLAIVAFLHCSRGGPTVPVFLGTISAGVVRAAVEKKLWRRLLWIGWFLLISWGSVLCHLDGYVGNPEYAKRFVPLNTFKSVREELRKESQTRKNIQLKEGWIGESWRAATGEDFIPWRCDSAFVGQYWHTWFTSVYSLETQHFGIWCPGGSLETCSESLDIRPRERER